MGHRGKILEDAQALVKFGQPGSAELAAIIGDKNMGQAEPAYNGLPYEVLHFRFSDLGQWFGLYPLRKVIYSYQEEFGSSRSRRKMSDYI